MLRVLAVCFAMLISSGAMAKDAKPKCQGMSFKATMDMIAGAGESVAKAGLNIRVFNDEKARAFFELVAELNGQKVEASPELTHIMVMYDEEKGFFDVYKGDCKVVNLAMPPNKIKAMLAIWDQRNV